MLRIRGVGVTFGDIAALDGADLEVADGEVVALLGPSGSGKSTLLRVVAGLQSAERGTVHWNGEDLAAVPAHERRFGMVFQDYALFPHLDIGGNVGFGPRMQGIPEPQRRRRIDAALERVELGGFAGRAVSTLSGGQAQRVALARALAAAPRLLLFDEPLGSLDKALRDRLVGELRSILAAPDITAVYVTHDLTEAFAVADRVAVMDEGRILQAAVPQELWCAPASERVAELLGLRTIVDATVAGGTATTPIGVIPVPDGSPEGPGRIVLRPEALTPDEHGPIEGVVASVAFRGVDSLLTVDTGGGRVEAVSPGAAGLSPGDRIRLVVDPAGIVVLRPAR